MPPKPDRFAAIWLALLPVLGRLTLALVFALAATFVFLKLADEVAEGATRRFDVGVLHFFHTHPSPAFHTLMLGLSWLAGPIGLPLVVGAGVLGFALARRFWPDGATLLIAAGGGLGLIMILKRFFHRDRPDPLFAHLGYSFPSGHSFFAFLIYGLLAYWLTRDASRGRKLGLWTISVALIALIGFSRVALGVHFPSDVAGGFAVALPWLWGCLALPTAFHRRGHDISPEESRARFERGRARLKEAALFLPNLVKLSARLARDPRVPVSRKIALALLAGYLALPFDLIPDFIPVLGVADDIILVSVTLGWVTKAVPREVIREHWDGEGDLFALLDRAREGINNLRNRA